MLLSAGCELTLKVHTDTPLVAMLRPRRGQQVLHESFILSRPLPVTQFTDSFGNICQRITAPQGALNIRSTMRVEAQDQIRVEPSAARVPVARLPDQTLEYTKASRYCPSDKLGKLAAQIVPSRATGYEQVQAIRDYVHQRVEYRYGVSDWTTDAEQTLNQGAGVCRDFAHVAIALCRAVDIPARMVAGYLHGLTPMDLHAWFEAYVGDRWYTFDAAEDELLGGRVVLAHGRDAADVAFLTGYGSLQLQRMKVWVERRADIEQDFLQAALAG